jgi:hypothetical protein
VLRDVTEIVSSLVVGSIATYLVCTTAYYRKLIRIKKMNLAQVDLVKKCLRQNGIDVSSLTFEALPEEFLRAGLDLSRPENQLGAAPYCILIGHGGHIAKESYGEIQISTSGAKIRLLTDGTIEVIRGVPPPGQRVLGRALLLPEQVGGLQRVRCAARGDGRPVRPGARLAGEPPGALQGGGRGAGRAPHLRSAPGPRLSRFFAAWAF